MAWSMRFEYDAQHDVVTAHFTDCILTNEADVLRWRREVEEHLSKYPGKVDLLINLDGLVVKVCSLDDLLWMKRASDRARDRDDLEALEAARDREGP